MTTPRPHDETPLPDRRIDAAWRAASAEEPPAALDAAILAAARREIGAGPRPVSAGRTSHTRRVWLPLAAAATIGAIAFGLLQLVTPDQLGAPVADNAVVTDVPAPAAKRAQELASTASREPAPKVNALAERKDEPAARRAEAPPPPAPATAAAAKTEAAPVRRDIAAAPDPFPAALQRGESAMTASVDSVPASSAAARVAEPEPSPASRPAPASAALGSAAVPPARQAQLGKVAAGRASDDTAVATQARASDGAALPVADWIVLIRRLRDEGKNDEASKELAAFRAVHPDHERLLPPDLRDWRPPAK